MRVISGELRSRVIETLEDDLSRPTSSKIRAAVFDHLGSSFSGGKMLDVFAGTGAMSYEALSRGYDEAVMLDKDYRAVGIIKKNVRNFGLNDRVEVIQADSYLHLQNLNDKFDLIFIDPPYQYDKIEEVLEEVASLELLSEKGYCIIETDRRYDLKDEYKSLKRYRSKKYGNTKIHYYQKA